MATEFTVTVERDPETSWLVAEVVEFPGCHIEPPTWRR